MSFEVASGWGRVVTARAAAGIRGNRWWTLGAMCFGLILINLDITIINTALPTIQRKLHASPSMLEWTVNAYALALAVLLLLAGSLGDRYGRRLVFLTGMALFTAFSAACALAPSAGWLVALRAGQGAGAAFIAALTLSIIVTTFEPRELPQAIGIYAGVSAVALAIGPLVGGTLTEHAGWASIFWINVPFGIAGIVLAVLAVTESRSAHSLELDPVGATLATVALFCVVWALIGTNHHAWTSGYTLGFLAASVVLGAAFVWWEERHRAPMVPLVFFRNRWFTVPALAQSLFFLALFGDIYLMTLYFQNVRGWSPVQSGASGLPMTMMMMILAPFGGWMQRRFRPVALVTAGLGAATVGLLGLVRLGAHTSFWYIAPLYVLQGLGMAIALPASSSIAMAAVDRQRSGMASGVLNSSRQVGAALGLAVMGAIGSTLAMRHWESHTPAAVHHGAVRDAVIGGQTRVIQRLLGSDAGRVAGDAFVSGVRGAMWAATGLTLLATLLVWLGLGRRAKPA